MKVTPEYQDDKKQVLIGQLGDLKEFEVSRDPILMKMLSMGLYSNPMRTMIQEVISNAWDSHCVSGRKDIPIDISVSELDGLTIRDHGLGIPDNDMHSIYCIYSNSTKRDDPNQIGGFGLGTKSPFAYTESFTVISRNEENCNTYLISRKSDTGEDIPSINSIFLSTNIKNNDTGLTVNIPIKDYSDYIQITNYIKELTFLSGIKYNITTDTQDEKLNISYGLKSNEFYFRENNYYTDHKIWAVYSGIKYKIPFNKEYSKEYKYILNFLSNNDEIFIEFSPNSLIPLPNREELNLSEFTLENITQKLEFIYSYMQDNLEDSVNIIIKNFFKDSKKESIPGIIAFQNMEKLLYKKIITTNIDNSHLDININNIIKLLLSNFKLVNLLINKKILKNIVLKNWIKYYPKHRTIAVNVLFNKNMHIENTNLIDQIFKETSLNLKKCEREFKKYFPYDILKNTQDIELYIYDESKLTKTTRFPLIRKNYYNRKLNKPIATSISNNKKRYEDYYKIWNKIHLFNFKLLLHDTVIIGRSIKSIRSSELIINNKYIKHIPHYVISNKKDAYEKAVKIFKSNGFKVIEAPIIKKVVTSKKVFNEIKPKEVIKYPLINLNRYDSWADKKETIEKPDLYYYSTLSNLNTYLHIKKPLMESFLKNVEKDKSINNVVMISNSNKIKRIESIGAISIGNYFIKWFEKLSKNKLEFKNIIKAILILKESNLTITVLKDPLIFKRFKITSKYGVDNHFWDKVYILKEIYYNNIEEVPIIKLRKDLANYINLYTVNSNKEYKYISSICSRTSIINSFLLDKYYNSNSKLNAKQLSNFLK